MQNVETKHIKIIVISCSIYFQCLCFEYQTLRHPNKLIHFQFAMHMILQFMSSNDTETVNEPYPL